MVFPKITRNQFQLLTLFLIFSVSIVFLEGCSEQSDDQQNPELLSKTTQGVEDEVFSNEYAKVLKVDIGPDQQLPWHKGGPRVIYSLSDYTIRLKKDPDDTTTKQSTLRQGDAHWHDQNIHSVENIGDTNAEFLVFMRKPSSFPEENSVSAQLDVQETVPSDTNVLLENESVKVINVTLQPDEKAPMHTGTKRLVYSINDYTIRYDTPEKPGEEQDFSEGDMHWHEGGKHSVNNIGDNAARFLVVEFKK